ncbi:MAG: NAD(+) diphosphatase [Lachnospiraceae bacterium]|nr:NAD(+) diphosphatase [Lachnospiraceae bacterium]
MIQDIYPSRLNNSYGPYEMREEDCALVFDEGGRLLVQVEEGVIRFPTGAQARGREAVYLFAVDERRYFLVPEADPLPESFRYYSLREMRDCGGSGTGIYAAFTAWHLWKWYRDNRLCGRCGSPLVLHEKERALRCPQCGQVIYPRINPAVIVGVIKGDCLLITRYRKGFAHNALVAGFTEIGETLEQTVEREVMEETGVKVKNIRYYKSQPWGMAQDILMGFYCEADGDGEIRVDRNELKYAEWVPREEIVLQPNNLSLTNEMMQRFKEQR